MPTFTITPTMPASHATDHGYPDPDVDPNGWIEAIRHGVAQRVQEHGLDLDEADRIIRIAIARADYEPPRALSEFEMEILEELAA